MNDFGKPIPAEKCLDCITVAGQAYCTMNCGPCVPPKKEPCKRGQAKQT